MTGLPDRVDAIARRSIDEGWVPGLVIRAERGGEALLEGAWGHSLLAGDDRRRMGAGTIFDMASLTKIFTTTAVLRLIQEGRLALGDAVAELYPAPRPGAEAGRLPELLAGLDLASLLRHSSGLHYWYPFYTRRGEDFDSILARVLSSHPRREGTVYSDLNFMILGRIVEAKTGLPLPKAIEGLVFSPLGLGRSSFGRPLGEAAAGGFGNRLERPMVENLGLSFDGWRDETRPILDEVDDGNCYYYFGGAAGHAGVFADARDLCRLASVYLERGRAEGVDYLAPELVDEALRDRGGGRGLGFQFGPLYPDGGLGHTGFAGTYLYLNARTGVSIAILANRLHVPAPRDIGPLRIELAEAILSSLGLEG